MAAGVDVVVVVMAGVDVVVVVMAGVDEIVGAEVSVLAVAAVLGATTRLNWKRETVGTAVGVVGAAVVAAVGAVGAAVVAAVVAAVGAVVEAAVVVTTRLNRKRETVGTAAWADVDADEVTAVSAAVDETVGEGDRCADGGARAGEEPITGADVVAAVGINGAAEALPPCPAGARPKKIFLRYKWIFTLIDIPS